MDLQSRKLEFIKEFLKIQSEEIVTRFESLLRNEASDLQQGDDMKPLHPDELQVRIDKALEDSKEGRVISASELISEIEKWS